VFRLLCLIEETFRVRLPLATIIQAQTLEQLALLLSDPERYAALDRMGGRGGKRPLFCVNYGLNLAKYIGSDQPVYELATVQEKVSKDCCVESLASSYVARVRAVQPEGPYFLSGYAASGIVAYEMAQQLWAQGQVVAFLGIVDTYLFPHPAWLLVRRFALHARTILRIQPSLWLGYLRGRLKAVQVRMTTRAPHRDDSPELPIWNLVSRLQPNYRPKPCPGRVTLFLPTGIPDNQFRELRSSWSRMIAAAGLDVVPVPGGHYSLVEEPHVRVLAAEVRARLDEAAMSGIPGNANHPEQLAKEHARTSIPI
jgi:thioesterase domain-containing protein